MFDSETFDQQWFWTHALAAIYTAGNIQALLSKIKPRMREWPSREAERLRIEKAERRRSVLKSSLVIRRISGGGGNGVYRDRDRAHMGCGRRLVVSGEVIYGYATVANGWAEEVRPNPGQVAVMISPGDEYSQLARTPAQRIGDTTVPKLKQETEQACKL